MNTLVAKKALGVLVRKAEAAAGRLLPIAPTLAAMGARPFELQLELTNVCNCACVFCPYPRQREPHAFMSDEVLEKALGDFVRSGGGSVGLTPIVGDALTHPKFLTYVRRMRSLPEIDRIWLATNAILVDRFGAREVLESGLTAITISTAGFQREMYERVFRSTSYERMRRNVTELVALNSEMGRPVHVTIGLRADRPLGEVLRDPDFQPILEHEPEIDFTWSFTSAGGRVTREDLPAGMRLRSVKSRPEPCAELYNGPVVLPDGRVQSCSCVASMDAFTDLGIGHVLEADLADIWRGERMRRIRAGFGTPGLNPTCAGCDSYRDLEFYRTRAGRRRAELCRLREAGKVVRNESKQSAFSGG